MNKIRFSALATSLLGMACAAMASSQAVKDFNHALARGVNLGNILEAPSEGSWGMTLDSSDLRLIAQKGFQSVRAPIRWDGKGDNKVRTYLRALRTEPYTIDPRFFARVDSLVSWSRQNHLLLVFNDHHHDSLFQNYEHEVPRFLAIWEQIANHYKDLPADSIGFEILNEPNTQVTAERWNWLLDTTLKIIRKTNPTRPVVIGTADWGGIGDMPLLRLPDDSNLILTIHDYNPFAFTHQGADFVDPPIPVGTRWGGYWDLRQSTDDVDRIAVVAKASDLPVWIGEFGALPYSDTASRRLWAASKALLYETRGFSWAWWEFKAGFGVYDPNDEVWDDSLVAALFTADTSIIRLGEVPHSDSDIAVNGDFSNGETGWAINLPSGQATFAVDSGSALVEVDSATPGTSWGVQLVQSPVLLQAGHSYVLTFTAWSDTDVSIDATVGMDYDPWTNYGSSNGLALGKEPKSFFTSLQVPATDTLARICFNLGNANARIRIDSVRLLEYTQPSTSVVAARRGSTSFRLTGSMLSRTGSVAPRSRHLLDARGAHVGEIAWVRRGQAWTADLSNAPRNKILFLDRDAFRFFLK